MVERFKTEGIEEIRRVARKVSYGGHFRQRLYEDRRVKEHHAKLHRVARGRYLTLILLQ